MKNQLLNVTVFPPTCLQWFFPIPSFRRCLAFEETYDFAIFIDYQQKIADYYKGMLEFDENLTTMKKQVCQACFGLLQFQNYRYSTSKPKWSSSVSFRENLTSRWIFCSIRLFWVLFCFSYSASIVITELGKRVWKRKWNWWFDLGNSSRAFK